MSSERFGALKFRNQDVTVVGLELKPGDTAPEFSAQTTAWGRFTGLQDTTGKVRIIASVPSLDTEVCDRETRRFNQEAASLSKEIVILVISMDLPYAQKRWCGAAGVDQVVVLSDHLGGEFGEKYGCLIKEVRLLSRAAFVVDKEGKIAYAEYLPSLGEEPDYNEVLAAAKSALAG